jgi:hypothetical protein
MDSALLQGQRHQRTSSFDENTAPPPPRGFSATPPEDMNKFSCWKVMMFIGGLSLSIVGGIIAAGGFALGGVGVLVTAPVGACIHAVGDSLMTASGVMMYIDRQNSQRAERESYNRTTRHLAPRHSAATRPGNNIGSLSGMGAGTRGRTTQTDTLEASPDDYRVISAPMQRKYPQVKKTTGQEEIDKLLGRTRTDDGLKSSDSYPDFETRGHHTSHRDTPRPEPTSPESAGPNTRPFGSAPHRPAPPPPRTTQQTTSATSTTSTTHKVSQQQPPPLISKRNKTDVV